MRTNLQLPDPNGAAARLLRTLAETEDDFVFPAPWELPAFIAAADELSRLRGWRVDAVFRSSKGYIGPLPSGYGHIGFCIERPAYWRSIADELDVPSETRAAA
jgi:hypothetical protein